MTAATILSGTCSTLNSNGERDSSSFGHNASMQVMQRNIKGATKNIQDYSPNDPLEQIDKIEVVQQSDTTVHLIADEEVNSDNPNLSCLSIPPIQNLLGVFEDNMNDNSKNKTTRKSSTKALIMSPEESASEKFCNTSPNGVEQYDDKSQSNHDKENQSQPLEDMRSSLIQTPYQRPFKLQLPTFHLHESLKLNLTQPVINRCSFYSVIHGVNKAVQEMAAEDQDGNIEETKDEDSALVLAVNGPAKVSTRREGPHVELAVLDEEKFLLAAIDSREEDEMLIRACPATFAEAIGEVEPDSTFANSQSENPLSVLASSRTQLWKPSRSWWEAKSGKNPWIEPKNHNKRWRYLWPLIHYHKFLAKCIKKLKRNNVDVKTSLSPVSAFLREEVCAVSDHLAATSKFTSEEWMEGLPHFNGWTNQDEESQEELNDIIKGIPMRSFMEPADVDSSLLRDQIDLCFLKAMAAARDQMENGRQENKSYDEGPMNSDRLAPKVKRASNSVAGQNFAASSIGCKPPRHGGAKASRSNRNVNTSRASNGPNRQWRNPRRAGNRMYGISHQDQSMMMQHHMQQQGLYPAPYNSSFHGHGSYVPSHYLSQSMNSSICGWNNPYGGNDYSNLNMSMSGMSGEWDQQYYGNHWEPSMDNEGSFHFRCDDSIASASIASTNHFETVQMNPQIPMHNLTQGVENGKSEGTSGVQNRMVSGPANDSFDEASQNSETIAMQTPSKDRRAPSTSTPASPSWAHLHMVPGLGTPVTQHCPSPHQPFDGSEGNQNNGGGMRGNNNWMNAKPLLINHSYNHYPQGGGALIPPSPATQFTMSPQANSQTTAYFAHGYPRASPPMQNFGAHANFVAPMQPYPQTSHVHEMTSQNDGQTLTEETSSETTSDTDN